MSLLLYRLVNKHKHGQINEIKWECINTLLTHEAEYKKRSTYEADVRLAESCKELTSTKLTLDEVILLYDRVSA